MADKLMMVLGFLCIGYFAGIAAYAGLSSKFPFLWAAAGVFFIAAGVLMHKRVQIPVGIRAAGIAAGGILLLFFIIIEASIVRSMKQKPDNNLDYIIVLGAQVKGETPSLSLKYRIQEAQKYLEENPDTKAILSGGKGTGENITEAECMYRELLEAGIEKQRLYKEEASINTNQNILFSREIIQENCAGGEERNLKIGIVTSSFHVLRGVLLAGKNMPGEIQGIPAKSNLFLLPNYMVREFMGLMKDKLAGNY